MKKFEINSIYYCRSIGDQNCIWLFRILSRTGKTLDLCDLSNGKKCTKKVEVIDDIEVCHPLGKYSMAPVLKADSVADTFLPNYCQYIKDNVRWDRNGVLWSDVLNSMDGIDKTWLSNGGFVEIVAESEDGEYDGHCEILDKDEVSSFLPSGMPCFIRVFTGYAMQVMINENIDAEEWYGEKGSMEPSVRCYILPYHYREIAEELQGKTIPDTPTKVEVIKNEPIKSMITATNETTAGVSPVTANEDYISQIRGLIENKGQIVVYQNIGADGENSKMIHTYLFEPNWDRHIKAVFDRGIVPELLTNFTSTEYLSVCSNVKEDVLKMMNDEKFSDVEKTIINGAFNDPSLFSVWKIAGYKNTRAYIFVLKIFTMA